MSVDRIGLIAGMEKKGPKKILVVDDEKDTVEMITTLLEMEGYEVISARSDAEAMKFLEVERLRVSESQKRRKSCRKTSLNIFSLSQYRRKN